MSLEQVSQHTLRGIMAQRMHSLAAFAEGRHNQKVSACLITAKPCATSQLWSETHTLWQVQTGIHSCKLRHSLSQQTMHICTYTIIGCFTNHALYSRTLLWLTRIYQFVI